MTSILKQENGELFIYRSEKEYPTGYCPCGMDTCTQRQEDWLYEAERIKVAEGEKERFMSMLYAQHNNINLHFIHERIENGTQEIPESCYEVREKAGVYGMTKKGNKYFPGESLAYFKDDRASEKETGLNSEIASRHINYGNKSYLEPDRPHENTSLDPKEHAIQFAEWIGKKTVDDPWFKFGWQGWYVHLKGHLSSEQLYNQFINRK